MRLVFVTNVTHEKLTDANIFRRRKDENGQILAFEINPRFSGSVASRSLIGHNEPDILIQYKLNHVIPETNKSIPCFCIDSLTFFNRSLYSFFSKSILIP